MSFDDVPLFMTPSQLAEITGEHVGSIRRASRREDSADKVNGKVAHLPRRGVSEREEGCVA